VALRGHVRLCLQGAPRRAAEPAQARAWRPAAPGASDVPSVCLSTSLASVKKP